MSVIATLWIVQNFKSHFFQYLKTIIHSSKEGAHITDEQVAFQHVVLSYH